MLRWAHLTAGIISFVVLSSLLIVFLRRWCCLRQPQISTTLNSASPFRSNSFQARISKLHQTSLVHQLDTSDTKRRGNINNYPVSRSKTGGFPLKPGLFLWTDHPALVTEAVENGWTRFGFLVHATAPLVTASSPGSVLLGLCTTAGSENPGVVITWEVSNGSVEFTQTIKFNQALKDTVNAKNPLMVLRAALPLPGPQLLSSTFPQEAYFEITILEILQRSRGGNVGCDVELVEGEKTKLFKSQGLKHIKTREWDGENEEAVLSLGLATGGFFSGGETRLPGKFLASIGFQSDGSVYLDVWDFIFGNKEWRATNILVTNQPSTSSRIPICYHTSLLLLTKGQQTTTLFI
ncbi:hypothetical protein CARUB_v10001307mg [Capsella rubella]|uniref:Uncharacterized protein n=1 Tax=Capsella rubella TaxID=81985 RepID=R0FFG1_9BRAS|nr:hypothetical protein CARUB_v10001307mg [Capsella rubella]